MRKHGDMRGDTGTNSNQEREKARVTSSLGKGYRVHPSGSGNSIPKGMEV